MSPLVLISSFFFAFRRKRCVSTWKCAFRTEISSVKLKLDVKDEHESNQNQFWVQVDNCDSWQTISSDTLQINKLKCSPGAYQIQKNGATNTNKLARLTFSKKIIKTSVFFFQIFNWRKSAFFRQRNQDKVSCGEIRFEMKHR